MLPKSKLVYYSMFYIVIFNGFMDDIVTTVF